MNMPPPPGQWGPGGQPPLPPQQPPPGYYPPQGGWGAPPPPPPKQNNTIKWLLAGVGVLLVIAITVGVTVLVTRDGSGGDGPSTTTSASGPPIASADDDGPIEIITVEPTCQEWMPVSNAMSQVQKTSKWGDRNPDLSATDWTPTERSQHDAVAKSMRETADQAVLLARQTPHRTIRELYTQFVYYARAYADSVADYTPADNYLALANVAASYSIDAVCESIKYGSAAARSTAVSPIEPPSDLVAPADPDKPDRVVSSANGTCSNLIRLRDKLVDDTDAWTDEDPNIPASDWSPERVALSKNTAQLMSTFADTLENLVAGIANPTFQDLASFGTIYIRAYVEALPTYESADSFLLIAGTRANNLLVTACQAVRE